MAVVGVVLEQEIAEVDELDPLLQRVRVEELEALEVADELVVRLDERRVVDRLLLPGRGREADLLGENRLARPRAAREDDERSERHAAAEDEVELGDAGLESLHQAASARSSERTVSRRTS